MAINYKLYLKYSYRSFFHSVANDKNGKKIISLHANIKIYFVNIRWRSCTSI